ncbi:TetR/AcrR family transcriptional regulator [Nesterenkonia flava]|uniref:TetR/AcrR family transcriptional regulator n=1 Tax=Nesterenkonia flava TaxID=469799 RepID=A0ABU1FR95_9MICC|nr:TetR/AcrR family transcriptional regulator [Nesterenkonia flava]MDR5711178.1 TetR/AcrR family transcriptional regulator [Nesterenkonia flava]
MTPGIRERLRAELTQELLTTAQRHLAQHGGAALSLRAIAREVGLAPSAVYRYFPDRDALLTALIVRAYTELGEAATAAEAAEEREDYRGRWRAVFRGVRDWALDHQHEYALIYGSPVPGYQAPRETIDPASRVALLLARVALDARLAGALRTPTAPELPQALLQDSEQRLSQVIQERLAEEYAERGTPLSASDPWLPIAVVDAWTLLFGAVSFELFGHYKKVIEAREAHMDYLALLTAETVGL